MITPQIDTNLDNINQEDVATLPNRTYKITQALYIPNNGYSAVAIPGRIINVEENDVLYLYARCETVANSRLWSANETNPTKMTAMYISF